MFKSFAFACYNTSLSQDYFIFLERFLNIGIKTETKKVILQHWFSFMLVVTDVFYWDRKETSHIPQKPGLKWCTESRWSMVLWKIELGLFLIDI